VTILPNRCPVSVDEEKPVSRQENPETTTRADVREDVELVGPDLALALCGLDHKGAGDGPRHGGGVVAVVHQPLGNVLCLNTSSVLRSNLNDSMKVYSAANANKTSLSGPKREQRRRASMVLRVVTSLTFSTIGQSHIGCLPAAAAARPTKSSVFSLKRLKKKQKPSQIS
jgi:hypothetical protein